MRTREATSFRCLHPPVLQLSERRLSARVQRESKCVRCGRKGWRANAAAAQSELWGLRVKSLR
jgi:hypothetical protein